jgi:hypothetical protein
MSSRHLLTALLSAVGLCFLLQPMRLPLALRLLLGQPLLTHDSLAINSYRHPQER